MSAAPELFDHCGARRFVLDDLLDSRALASRELRSRFGLHACVVLRLRQQTVRELLVVELDVLFLAVDERLHRDLRHWASCSIPLPAGSVGPAHPRIPAGGPTWKS